MKNRARNLRLKVILFLCAATASEAGIYRIVPSEADVLPGETIGLTAEVVTELGDNTVGVGYFSFALDLTLTGTSVAIGDDIGGVVINEASFDDLSSNSLGFAQGGQYLGIAGVTLDLVAPTFGQDIGVATWLFDFDLTVPFAAEFGETITITPSEGTLENLIANASFDNVAPQYFQPTTLTVVPEPTTAVLLVALLGLSTVFRVRRRTY